MYKGVEVLLNKSRERVVNLWR